MAGTAHRHACIHARKAPHADTNLAPGSASVYICLHSRSRTRRHTEHTRRTESALGRMCMAGSGPHAHLRAGDAASAEARHPDSTVATTARRGIQGWQGAAVFSSAPRSDGGHFLSSRKAWRTASSPRVLQSHSLTTQGEGKPVLNPEFSDDTGNYLPFSQQTRYVLLLTGKSLRIARGHPRHPSRTTSQKTSAGSV